MLDQIVQPYKQEQQTGCLSFKSHITNLTRKMAIGLPQIVQP